MSERKVYPHNNLQNADLVIDAVYKGGDAPNYSSAPLPDLLGVGTGKGFRQKSCPSESHKHSFIVLFTTFSDPDWPDHLDAENGIFTYYGDNKEPGSTIHKKEGNKILRDVFDNLHNGDRRAIPPFFVFNSTGEGYDRKFRGLAVPGIKLKINLRTLSQSGNTEEEIDSKTTELRSRFLTLSGFPVHGYRISKRATS